MVSFKLTVRVLALITSQAYVAAKITMPDCSDEKNQGSAECICRLPSNWDKDICKGPKWFGKRSSDIGTMIIGGEEVDPNVYPWFARATIDNDWGGCGGSLVAPEYVLTAAHCVDGRIKKLKNKGGYQIGALCAPYGPSNSKNCGQKVEKFGINNIIKHPDYNPNTFNNDFALVRLSDRSTITPVSMDQGNISPGYEDVDFKTNLWPSKCKSQYVSDPITDSMMCASDQGQDACNGDSGGPLYDSDTNTLVGVVSWGIECADPNYPGVYARISNQFSWIKQTICAAHGNPKPDFCGNNPPPTPPPSNPSPCPSGQKLLEIEINTDDYGSVDNMFKVKKWEKNNWKKWKNVWMEYNLQDNSSMTFQRCFPVNQCHKFVIVDFSGNGMCCEDGQGGYKLMWGGTVIKNSQFKKGTKQAKKFGNKC